MTGRAQLAVLDYGMGNLRSVEKALEHTGADVLRTGDAEQARGAAGLVLPGVGAFPTAMDRIRGLGLDELVMERAGQGTPILGICLGMQLLFDRSEELGGAEGIGLLPGDVERLSANGHKLPQIGWNPVSWSRESPLTADLPQPCAFYHVHTFAPRLGRDEDLLGSADYGESFATAVARENVFGVQFHPEKSGPDGLRMLANFTELCR